jgi:uncharacterized protein YyaL (SSP411 family)
VTGVQTCALPIYASLRLGRPDCLNAALEAGDLVWDLHWIDHRLRRVSRDGAVGAHAGVLEDYGLVAAAYLDLVKATTDARWLHRARTILDTALAIFVDGKGGFFDTAGDAEGLLTRPSDVADNASPSGTSAMVHALVTAHALTGHGPYRDAAESALATTAQLMAQAPRFTGWSLAAATAMESGPEEIAVVGPAGPERDLLAAQARQRPGAVVIVTEGPSEDIPLLADRPAIDGRPTAYVCRGFVCERPVHEL